MKGTERKGKETRQSKGWKGKSIREKAVEGKKEGNGGKGKGKGKWDIKRGTNAKEG